MQLSLTIPRFGNGAADPHGDTSALPIRFENVGKSFGPVQAVVSVDLSIRAGEFLTLLGPSGSGKSTLLMLLAGFESPTTGRVLIGERDMRSIPADRRNQGVVFQGYALFPHMTVAENLAYPLVCRGIVGTRQRDLVHRALERVRMTGYENRYPAELSGGQQQRVALARSIVFEPPVLLMDESLSALDRRLREEMQIELKSLHEELANTVVYVTHDQDEALTMSDRVAVLDGGRLAQLGTPATVYDEPENAFVAGFLGDSNLLAATVDSVESGCVVLRLDSGHELKATQKPSRALVRGDRVQLLVRPERVRLHPLAGASTTPIDRLPGEVSAKIFRGGSYHYRVKSADLLLDVRHLRSGDQAIFQPGDPVEIELPASDIRILVA